jgi:hypothetical protein
LSLPDYILLARDGNIPPRFPDFPHAVALLPSGIGVDQLGTEAARSCCCFLVDPDCAHVALNDPALSAYLVERLPVIVSAQRRRDLKPFLRRADAFRARGYSVEVMP